MRWATKFTSATDRKLVANPIRSICYSNVVLVASDFPEESPVMQRLKYLQNTRKGRSKANN